MTVEYLKKSLLFFNFFFGLEMKIRMNKFYFFAYTFLSLNLLLNACANQSLQKPEASVEQATTIDEKGNTITDIEQKLQVTLSPDLSPALTSLLGTAEKQMLAEDLNGAAASLERALRISPSEAVVHLRLAEVRLKQGQAHAALQMAFKGQALMENRGDFADKAVLEKRFWQVIGDCYSALGNYQKAQQAYQKR